MIGLCIANRAPVAQLDRASAFEAEGRGFEPLQARHFSPVFMRFQGHYQNGFRDGCVQGKPKGGNSLERVGGRCRKKWVA